MRTPLNTLLTPRNDAMHKAGFTLIELAVVLVIIGLIVGGALVGRDLLKAAELRSAISSIERFNVAVSTFRLKYNCMPADCTNASSFIAGASNGDGTGLVNALGEGDDGLSEVFFQLNASGLLSAQIGTPSFVPLKLNNAALGGVFQEPNDAGAINKTSRMLLSLTLPFDGDGFFRNALTPLQAKTIDEKLDDGVPLTGRVLALNETDEFLRVTGYISSGSSNDGTSCLTDDTTPVQYNNLTSTDWLCAIAYDFQPN